MSREEKMEKLSKLCSLLHEANWILLELYYEEFHEVDSDWSSYLAGDSDALHAMWSMELMNRYLTHMVPDPPSLSEGLVGDIARYFAGSRKSQSAGEA